MFIRNTQYNTHIFILQFYLQIKWFHSSVDAGSSISRGDKMKNLGLLIILPTGEIKRNYHKNLMLAK